MPGGHVAPTGTAPIDRGIMAFTVISSKAAADSSERLMRVQTRDSARLDAVIVDAF
jgi:hypothetical protein